LNYFYSPSEGFEINPLDPDLGIQWPLELVGSLELIPSLRDVQAPKRAEPAAVGKLPTGMV
jgi:dTDP-4-dehydrorhamnose 3,5-epimerase-like enzyme